MDDKPSLRQYFGDNTKDLPPASQFFDEIGTSPSDIRDNILLGDNDANEGVKANLFAQNPATSSVKSEAVIDLPLSNSELTANTSSAVPASSMPDPARFFDTVEPHSRAAPPKSTTQTDVLSSAMDGLVITNQPADKDEERRRDAWIPSEEAKKTLLKAQSSPKGSFFPEREVLTMPGLVLEQELPDALQEAVVQLLGVSSAGSRGVVRAEHVSRDEAGLKELLRTGYLRAAVNLSGTLLTAAGQGAGRMHRPSKNTPRTLQFWLTRFCVMLHIQLNDSLAQEAEPFGDCDKPDMYYQFYPDLYENRTGSIAPFSLRLLLAELPGQLGKPEESINKLFSMYFTIQQMLANLNAGKTEDGAASLSSEQDKVESIKLWTDREARVQNSIINCAVNMKDYRSASDIITQMLGKMSSPQQRRACHSALCRLWLLAGNTRAARAAMHAAREIRLLTCPTPDLREYVDMGLIDIALGKYDEAYNSFALAFEQQPTNVMVANNLSVCLLYMGRLKEAISVVQKAINADPNRGLSKSLLVNLCTLYELESSKANEKKLALLRLLCKFKSDTIPNVLQCLKLNI